MATHADRSFALYEERKAALMSSLRGTILEIGPGTGVNLQFLDPSVRWIGIEPNRAMHVHLHAKANALGLSIDLRADPLVEASVEPESVDAVISTLVLCSVPSIPRMLEDILRVLRPGGSFTFIEHVVDRPGTLRRSVQKILPYTPWRYLTDGCNPGRDIAAALHTAGFSTVECEPYLQAGPGLVLAINRPHIAGRAIK